MESNTVLCDYYTSQGYTHVGRRDFEGPWFSAALFEKTLRPQTSRAPTRSRDIKITTLAEVTRPEMVDCGDGQQQIWAPRSDLRDRPTGSSQLRMQISGTGQSKRFQ
ncbi:hypothetical protein [Leekyejoonella antrihumi]|uniref:Uncharacterized protein n=1 Tax=Leekyejoonella antrihumi TaxID=1660198 RepID=A0A563DV46_9MICO|nr:hypothetical protein [Leekyejoonella antrihumi]TWP34137.1 hypothetical protein FGL98_18730 [Leekyejoonella antrihumi]